MAIKSKLAVIMAEQEVRGKELAEKIGITEANLSKLKTGKIKAIRFSTLSALCKALNCQPGDLLVYIKEE